MVLSCGRLCFAAAHPRASGPTHMHPTEFTAAIRSPSIPGCAGLCSQLKQQWRVGSGFATARCQHASAPMHSLCVHVQPCGAGLSLLPPPCTSGACIASPVQHGRGRWDAGGMQAQHSQHTRPAPPLTHAPHAEVRRHPRHQRPVLLGRQHGQLGQAHKHGLGLRPVPRCAPRRLHPPPQHPCWPLRLPPNSLTPAQQPIPELYFHVSTMTNAVSAAAPALAGVCCS